MKTEPPILLPLFRSDAQARLLARLYLRPGEQKPLSELARELGLSHATISREADRLERAGLIRSDHIGKQRLLHADETSRYYVSLRDLLTRAFGPVPVLERSLRGRDGVERAFLYGSWAARYLGEAGEAPRDLDLLIVGSPSRRAIARLSADLARELGYEINPTIVPTSEWETKKSPFLRTVSRAPLVELTLAAE